MNRARAETRIVRGVLTRLNAFCPWTETIGEFSSGSLADEVHARRLSAGKRAAKLSELLQAKLREKFETTHQSPAGDCRSLAARLRTLNLETDIHSLAILSDAFYALKQLHWPLFGSDLLVLLQALSSN